MPHTCATMKWASSFLTSRSRHGDPQLKFGCLLSVGNLKSSRIETIEIGMASNPKQLRIPKGSLKNIFKLPSLKFSIHLFEISPGWRWFYHVFTIWTLFSHDITKEKITFTISNQIIFVFDGVLVKIITAVDHRLTEISAVRPWRKNLQFSLLFWD